MLNRHKVLNQLSKIIPTVYANTTQELQFAKYIWQELIVNNQVSQKLNGIASEYIMPTWQEPLNTAIEIKPKLSPYQVVAVDGSQIYPDRHQGIGCYLINLGLAHLNYGLANSQVLFDSIPQIFTDASFSGELSPDMVNSKRTELELSYGFQATKTAVDKNSQIDTVFLCDGSLIFWHLDSKDEQTKQKFLINYLSSLDQFFHNKILMAGFISLPKSKEIINIIKTCLSKKLIETNSEINTLDYLVDTDILENFLPSYSRSAVFANHSVIVADYPAHLKPYFIYLNISDEIARIEIPAWIAQNQNYTETVLAIIVDQCIKGRGYPVALSESHEQAVVKNFDRDFFYQMLSKVSLDNNQKFKISQKSLKKRHIAI